MADSVAGLVLAAGAGTRLRPLTRLRPKPLCPLGDAPLIDHVLLRFAGVTTAVAVNVHHHRDQMGAHLSGRAHLSFEEFEPLGTAGAVAHLRSWIDGRSVVVVNGDSWCPAPLRSLLDGWDGERPRLLVPDGATFDPRTPIAGALLPWPDVAALPTGRSGLYDTVWARAAAQGRLDLVPMAAGVPLHDCGTPAAYLGANLAWSGGTSVIGAGALVDPGAVVDRSVVWPGSEVTASEHLVDAIRAGPMTVVVR
jgi:N-acetyl-alpha-D-muramate 1-phosphate uridylyltransferase